MKKKIRDKNDSFGYLTSRAGSTIMKSMREQLKHAGVEMPPEQMEILFYLWEKDGQNQKELNEGHFKNKATITRGISSLEKYNLVIRVTDEKDKRNRKVYLTHKGKELETIVKSIAYQTQNNAIKGISKRDLETCKKVLNKIYENLK